MCPETGDSSGRIRRRKTFEPATGLRMGPRGRISSSFEANLVEGHGTSGGSIIVVSTPSTPGLTPRVLFLLFLPHLRVHGGECEVRLSSGAKREQLFGSCLPLLIFLSNRPPQMLSSGASACPMRVALPRQLGREPSPKTLHPPQKQHHVARSGGLWSLHSPPDEK